ncbi:MAG: hypothetical protein ACI9W4_001550 [Rhodothermales bacterium]|jgi:hypothetical protein
MLHDPFFRHRIRLLLFYSVLGMIVGGVIHLTEKAEFPTIGLAFGGGAGAFLALMKHTRMARWLQGRPFWQALPLKGGILFLLSVGLSLAFVFVLDRADCCAMW